MTKEPAGKTQVCPKLAGQSALLVLYIDEGSEHTVKQCNPP
jgi:hypothetical protein